MTNEDAIKKMQAVKAYMISGNPIWSVTEMGEAFDMAIEALKQNQWILCSERLPEKDDCVFVYLFADSPYIAWYDGVDWCTDDFALEKDEEPIAWMPLPKPWKGEQNERDL